MIWIYIVHRYFDFLLIVFFFFEQPEAFVKVRPRCEAPRRDVVYPMNYTPCRYVRISCLRGNPIAIFFIQVERRLVIPQRRCVFSFCVKLLLLFGDILILVK